MPYYLGMNIKTKRNLHHWDFPNIQKVGINDIVQDVPELTEENFWTLIDDYNKLIKCFNGINADSVCQSRFFGIMG